MQAAPPQPRLAPPGVRVPTHGDPGSCRLSTRPDLIRRSKELRNVSDQSQKLTLPALDYLPPPAAQSPSLPVASAINLLSTAQLVLFREAA